MAWNRSLSRRLSRIDSISQNQYVDKTICTAAPHFYKYLFGSTSTMVCSEKITKSIDNYIFYHRWIYAGLDHIKKLVLLSVDKSRHFMQYV